MYLQEMPTKIPFYSGGGHRSFQRLKNLFCINAVSFHAETQSNDECHAFAICIMLLESQTRYKGV